MHWTISLVNIIAKSLMLQVQGIIIGQKLAFNKRFKADSQRMAFSPCVDFCGNGGMQKHRIALLTT
ncbi:hypothetical protein OC523_007655 [Vibrio vulnificus]